jgi:hypothetical protein
VVVDDLDVLELHLAGGCFVNTRMVGWMCKCNVLVQFDQAGQTIHAYQIVTLDFERCLSGRLKVRGARATQKVPSGLATFEMSSGASGRSIESDLSAGVAYSASARGTFWAVRQPPTVERMHEAAGTATDAEALLVSCSGKLCVASEAHTSLIEFVVNRPNKLLHQRGGVLAWSPEEGDGAHFSSVGCMMIDVQSLALPILERVGVAASQLDLAKAVCFVQPTYVLVDHHNLPLHAD